MQYFSLLFPTCILFFTHYLDFATAHQKRHAEEPLRSRLRLSDGDLINDLRFHSRKLALSKLWSSRTRDDIIEMVSGFHASTSFCFNEYDLSSEANTSKKDEMSGLDRAMKSFSVSCAYILAWQCITSVLNHNEELIDKVTEKFLSSESVGAIKAIRKMITQLKEHGVVDIFRDYSTKDIVSSFLALFKLQQAAAYYGEQKRTEGHSVNKKLLQRLAYYSVFANAAYGWKMEAASNGKLDRGNLRTLVRKTGIKEEDVVAAKWASKTHRPAYFIVRDLKHRKIVLSIRGTFSARDVLTDLCASAETFETGRRGKHRAHHGMLEAAISLATETKETVEKELHANPGYSLVLVGHSLGGGVAAVLGTLWEKDYPNLQVYGYGSPCVSPADARPTTCKNIISVLGEGDPFACLSLGHIANLSKALSLLCEDKDFRSMIMIRTDNTLENMEIQDLQWCEKTLINLRVKMKGEIMYPPGRLFFMKRSLEGSVISIREVHRSKFSELKLHPRMLDVSRHVPSLYESLLQEMCGLDI